MDTGTIYHVCLKREWVASFEKLDGGLVIFDDGHTCQIEGIDIVRIKLFSWIIRELKDVRYAPQLKKINFNWSFEGAKLKRDSWRRRSQNI